MFNESTTGIRNGRRKVLASKYKFLVMKLETRTLKITIMARVRQEEKF